MDVGIRPLSDVVQALGSDLARGLSSREAQRRLADLGRNEILSEPSVPLWKRFLAQFTNVLILMLCAAGVVSMALGELAEGIAILVTVLINASIAVSSGACAQLTPSNHLRPAASFVPCSCV